MANHVYLDIVPDGIGADDWATAYDTTLRLLMAHPSRLVGFDWMMVCGTRLPVYTRSIERYPDCEGKRHWSVAGDRTSLRMGECQTMYRDLRHYRRFGWGEPPPLTDILQCAADEKASQRLVQVFGDQTQGQPYHLPLLAAAIVVESRFPLRAMVSGDIDRPQADAARRFAQSVLHTPVALPVRVDGPRLVERLGRFLEGDALTRAFERLNLSVPHLGLRVATSARSLDDGGAPGKPGYAPKPLAPTPQLPRDMPHAGAAPMTARLASLITDGPTGDTERGATSLDDPLRRHDIEALAFAVRRKQSRIRLLARNVDGGVSAATGAGSPSSARECALAAVLGCGNPSMLRRAIAQVLSQRGPTLTEDAWDRISREADLDVLEFLLTLAIIQSGPNDFFELQRAMFEDEALSAYAAHAAKDEPLMARLAETLATPIPRR